MKQTLGPYTLVAKLGEGGMAEVFKAIKTGPQGFEKPVALKRILPPYHDRQEMVRMFLAEAKLHAQLTHPKLVHLIDFFEENGGFVLVMEYFQSKNLSQVLADAKRKGLALPWQAAVFICTELLEALDYAHKKRTDAGPLGIVHRDISPQNVLLSQNGWVKLTDFGIAMANVERDKTDSNVLKGKVRYLSPEQIQEKRADLRSDLFSMGSLLYEMICHRHPFHAKVDYEILNLIVEGKYKPSRTLAPNVPFAVHDCITTALEHNPASRYPNAAFMRFQLLKSQDPGWINHGTELLKQWLGNVYDQDDFHNEAALSQTKALPKRKTSRRTPWLLAGLLASLTVALALRTFEPKASDIEPTPTQPQKNLTKATLPRKSFLRFTGSEGSQVFINGKKIGNLPMEDYEMKPGSYVILMVTVKGKKTISNVTLHEGETASLQESP